MADIADRTEDFGANSWLVEEMYEQFRTDPSSVSEAWRDFFSDYKSAATGVLRPAPAASTVASSNVSATGLVSTPAAADL